MIAEKGSFENHQEIKHPSGPLMLTLYVAGQTPNCLRAFANLKNICEQELKGQYELQVVDLMVQPELARGEQILAIPTLIRQLPLPVKRVVGSLHDTERVLVGLDLKKKSEKG